MSKQDKHKKNKIKTPTLAKKRNWLQILISEAIKNGNFQSKLIKEYYFEISIPYIKNVSRTGLIVFLFYIYLCICRTHDQKTHIRNMFVNNLALYILLLCLTTTLFIKTYRNYIRMSLVAIITVLIHYMLNNYGMEVQLEIMYSPILQIVILIFSFNLLNIGAAMSISLLTICSMFLVTTMRISNDHLKDKVNKINKTEIFKTYSKSRLSSFHIDSYIIGQAFLWIAAFFAAFYMSTCNRLWRQSAFITLGETVQVKRTSKHAMKEQLRWIEAIMPGVVKDEYWAHSQDIKVDKWVYIKAFDNVSILFADIVGFTKMSSNKSAPQVVTLLNDLFNKFDELCILTNCEKIGTLGDCYYCVAGCPIPRQDHAFSCIEMGLGMCLIIKQFNREHKENVNMRVGVHTGRVNAAIIGTQRFRFDVYSYDVIIANAMESSGKPGRVHVSQTVYELIRNAYKVEPGDELEIKREEDHGIAGMLLKSYFIKTYFVDPHSSHFKKQGGKMTNTKSFHVLDNVTEPLDSESESDTILRDEVTLTRRSRRQSSISKPYALKIDEEVIFIDSLRSDPDKQVFCFYDPPINIITSSFYDSEVEWHFRNHTIDHVQDVSLYSTKLAPIVECIVSLVCTFFILLAILAFFYNDLSMMKNEYGILGLFMLHITLIVIEFWKSSTYHSLLSKEFDRIVYLLLSHDLYKSIICVYMTLLPSLMCFMMIYNCKTYSNDYYFQVRYFSLNLFSFLNGSLFISTLSWVKIFALTLNFIQSLYFGYFLSCESIICGVPFTSFYACPIKLDSHSNFQNNDFLSDYVYQYCFTFIVLIILVRERERNLRIWFYVSREAEIGKEQAQGAMESSQELLYNIIPKYVFDYVKQRGGDNVEYSSFNYAFAINKAGVVFACISNFFSKYYREDYKGGGNALKLLHTIITQFDHLLMKKQYKDVEKIKTINDCYMLASGLNPTASEFQEKKIGYLIALMNYAFDMQKILSNFNEHYIIGNDKFEIKIGYNYGPVTAGIIGSTKPMYDIWGDTVNVSSRMYSTGKPGEIQVPDYVAEELKSYFTFKYRGKIFVKGKGDMNTYLCISPFENN